MNAAPKLQDPTSNNRRLLRPGVACGCCHCLEVFGPDDMVDWLDDGQTAVCPRCGVDAVVADRPDAATPRRMRAARFGIGIAATP